MAAKLNRISCREHPDAALIEDYRAGDMICSACGLVVGDRVIDVGSEWRTFTNEKAASDPSRVGASENPLLNGNDLSTIISSLNVDNEDGPKYHNRKNMSSSERTLINAFREISNMADRINLTKTIVGECIIPSPPCQSLVINECIYFLEIEQIYCLNKSMTVKH